MARAAKGPRPIADALRSLDESFLMCRTLGHAWMIDSYQAVGADVVRYLACGRCGTERADHWTRRGERQQPSYHYAKGYSLTGTDVPGDREAMRREELRRMGYTAERVRARKG